MKAKINHSKEVDQLTERSIELIENLLKTPSDSALQQSVEEIDRQLGLLDPESQDQNLQLLRGAILAIAEAIEDLVKYDFNESEQTFFKKQILGSLQDLRRMSQAFQAKSQEEFDKMYIYALLKGYRLDVLEGSFLLSQALEKLPKGQWEIPLLNQIYEIYMNIFSAAAFARGTNARTLVQSLSWALRTLYDCWPKLNEEQKQKFFTELKIMNAKILGLLDFPSYRELGQFKESFKNIIQIVQTFI